MMSAHINGMAHAHAHSSAPRHRKSSRLCTRTGAPVRYAGTSRTTAASRLLLHQSRRKLSKGSLTLLCSDFGDHVVQQQMESWPVTTGRSRGLATTCGRSTEAASDEQRRHTDAGKKGGGHTLSDAGVPYLHLAGCEKAPWLRLPQVPFPRGSRPLIMPLNALTMPPCYG